jgi:hypothetical protein
MNASVPAKSVDASVRSRAMPRSASLTRPSRVRPRQLAGSMSREDVGADATGVVDAHEVTPRRRRS